ncbi:DUF805 domain-containing protein [soil metagenome]
MPEAFAQTFCFAGRVSRAGYWRWQLALAIIGALLWVGMIFFAMGGIAPVAFGLLCVLAVFVYASVGVSVRRLHDRGKSGWWLLLFQGFPILIGATQWFVEQRFSQPMGTSGALLLLILSLASVGVSIWGLVEIGFLRGTPDVNAYGDRP